MKFEQEYVRVMWSDDLEGNKCFVSDRIGELILIVEKEFLARYGRVEQTGSRDFPFRSNGSLWRFAYFDPCFTLKQAREEGKVIERFWESEQETLLRCQQAAAIYGIPEWEREEVRERVYSQYLRSYNELPPKDKRGSQPYSLEKFLKDFRFDWFSLCVRCKLCGTMNGWGGHHGMLCGGYTQRRPREFGWHGGCDLYEPIEPEFVQLDLFGTEEE